MTSLSATRLLEGTVASVGGVIEAEDRKAALQLLGQTRTVSVEPRDLSYRVVSG